MLLEPTKTQEATDTNGGRVMSEDIFAATEQRLIKEALTKLEPKQLAFFHRLYPGGIGEMDRPKRNSAMRQIENTIRKNEAT